MPRLAISLLLLVSPAAFGQKAPAPGKEKVVIRSGEVIRCHVGQGCTEETEAGHRYLVMDVDGFLVKAALVQQAKVSLADIQVTNETESRMQVKPSDFRLEVSGLKYRRLAALDPVTLHRLLDEAHGTQQKIGHGLPDPSYWSSAQHTRDREAMAVVDSSKATLLHTGEVGPHETMTGRVYFERQPGTTDVSLILPFQGGSILEFPFLAAPTAKHKKQKPTAD